LRSGGVGEVTGACARRQAVASDVTRAPARQNRIAVRSIERSYTPIRV
jgi:hypothetical protein